MYLWNMSCYISRHIFPRFKRFIGNLCFRPARVFYFENYLEGLLFSIIDLVFIPELLEMVYSIFNFKLSKLSLEEIRKAQNIFGENISYWRVRKFEHDRLISKKLNIAFVSFYIIHSYGPLSENTLIHELAHIWQFEKFGSIYISKSLRAQLSKEGYDYGGIENLTDLKNRKASILKFNFEQMATILEDAYRISESGKIKEPYKYFQEQVLYASNNSDILA